MITLPKSWQAALSGYQLRNDTMGRSHAGVIKASATDREPLFLKFEALETPSVKAELPGEIERLNWLHTVGMSCPEVLEVAEENGHLWLLMTGLKGLDLASDETVSPARRIEMIQEAIHSFHSLDVTTCPFDERVATKIESARVRVQMNLVDESEFDEERLGRTASALYEDLCSWSPDESNLVVVHGDPCLPNFIASGGCYVGAIDCGRVGVADRALDIAIAARSIHYNLGETWRDRFLEHFGYEPDDEQLAYYRLLDEFF